MQQYESITNTELQALYVQYLDADIEVIGIIGNSSPIVYVWESLSVPDTKNYTVDDIYNCFVQHLTQYTELNT